jgi:hypothetical protein
MGTSKAEQLHHYDLIELAPEHALFGSSGPQAKLDGFVATFHTNERPLQGLAGILDWHFHGAISNYLRAGAVSGEVGECAYLPLFLPVVDAHGKPGRVYHILLAGAGTSASPGSRQELDDRVYSTLRKNIQSLKIARLGISQSDLGNASRESIAKHFKEVPLWIVR